MDKAISPTKAPKAPHQTNISPSTRKKSSTFSSNHFPTPSHTLVSHSLSLVFLFLFLFFSFDRFTARNIFFFCEV
jgi:hypothetical protein